MKTASAVLFVTTISMALTWGACSPQLGTPSAAVEEGNHKPETDPAVAAQDQMPPTLRQAFIASRMAEADGRYAVYQGSAGELVAVHPHTRMRSGFTPAGVQIGPWEEGQTDAGQPGVTLSLKGVGRNRVQAPVHRVTPRFQENRVEYPRANILEWYLHGPLGLEQGFTLDSKPGGPGELAIQVELGGEWSPRRVDERVELLDRQGRVRAVYSDLFAKDASGVFLPARMELQGRTVALIVRDEHARYPLTVDPLIVIMDGKLLPTGATLVGNFGFSVAIEGSTAVIGAYGDDTAGVKAGAVYIFEDNGRWSQIQRITASDAADWNYFGYSVALSGDWLVVGSPTNLGATTPAAYMFHREFNTWTEQQKLTATDVTEDTGFGESVAIDGSTLMVGAPKDDTQGNNRGAVYWLEFDGVAWSPAGKRTVADGADNDGFGSSVAISGDTLLVGAPHMAMSMTETGAVYVFERPGSWLQQDKWVPSDGVGNDKFGWSVLISGDDAVVGANGADHGGMLDAGAVYVYTRSGGVWSQQAKLTASDADFYDGFGNSVSLSGNTLAVGSPYDDGATSDFGAAYVFVRSGTTWTEQAKLTASEGWEADRLGVAVAVAGDALLAGASLDSDAAFDAGSAYVFRRDGAVWTEERELYPIVLDEEAYFGMSIALDGDTAAVGAPGGWSHGAVEGTVRVFTRSGGRWSEEAELTASDAAPGKGFGWSVALQGDTLAIGADRDDENGGAVYLFTRSGGLWTEQQKLMGDGPVTNARFGWRVALSGDTLVVGAPGDDGIVINAGAAYLFVFDGVGWVRQARLTASDGASTDQFGSAVAIHLDSLVVGAQDDDDQGAGSGSAYVFTRAAGIWTEVLKLTATDGSAISAFGCSAAITQDALVVGAFRADHPVAGADAGAAYVFTGSGGSWQEQSILVPQNIGSNDFFGRSVALEGDTLVISAYTDDAGGSVHWYTRNSGSWTYLNRLTAWGSETGFYFGHSVALDGDSLAVGEPGSSGGGAFTGAAYVFRVTGAGNGTPCPGPFACASGLCVDGVCCDTDCGGGLAGDCMACSLADGATTDGVCSVTDGWTCDDGDACTMDDACAGNTCSGVALDGDSDGYVADACGGTDCDDSSDAVHPGVFEGGSGTPICLDGIDNDCNGLVDAEQGACLGCTTNADCEDGNFCNGPELCAAGVCQLGNPPDCDDGDDCTDDVCDPATGCQHTDSSGPCDDENACTENDTCEAGTCAGSTVDCLDGDPCTDDSCDPATGCVHSPDPDCCFADSDCDDSDACTTDTCQAASHTCAHTDIENCGGGSGSGACATAPVGRSGLGFALLLGLMLVGAMVRRLRRRDVS